MQGAIGTMFRMFRYTGQVAKRKRKRRTSYAWAAPLHTAGITLSADGKRGLGYARELAANAADRRAALLAGEAVLPYRLTVNDLAAREDESPISVHTLIKCARTEAFGDRCQSALFRHLARRREIAERSDRICAEPACTTLLPHCSTVRRRFCDQHQRVAERVRRHRARLSSVPRS